MIPLNMMPINSKEDVSKILMNRGKIVVIAEEVPEYLNHPMYGSSCIRANNLLPDIDAVECYINQNFLGFRERYMQKLISEECTIYFITIITALLNNIPIGILFGIEEIELKARDIILEFLEAYYGIHLAINFGEISFMHPEFIAKDISMLYVYGMLTPQEFLYIYPLENLIDNTCMEKLLYDLKPPINLNNPNEIISYFNNMRSQMKQANKVLIDPVEKV